VKAFLKKLNNLPVFDPCLWPRRELLARIAGLSICTAFIIHRICRFTLYTGKIPPFLRGAFGLIRGERALSDIHMGPGDWHWIMWCLVWIIETGIFGGYILAFVSRKEARCVAKGFLEVVFPLMVAAIPVSITLTPMNFMAVWPPLLGHAGDHLSGFMGTAAAARLFASWEPAFLCFMTIIIFGGIMNLIGLLTLRRSFTIMSEARMLIRRGIFSVVRHPLYAAHFIMFFGYLMFHLYWYTCLLYVAFLAGQYLRARIEEGKLMSVFPEYAGYRKVTGMFFPKLSL
jgi:protein-S-isoprenylcysteine O-methyltransferase Ste14